MRARGFTLIEVLIAMGIVAAMAVMTIGSLSEIDRASTQVRQQEDQESAGRVALSRLTRELEMAFLSDNYDTAHYRDPLTLFIGSGDDVLFTTFAHVRLYRDAKESDQSIVEYSVESDPDHPGERALIRREKPRLDDEPDRGGHKDLVADHVTSLTLQYWDKVRKEWVREWSTRTPERAKELPQRVRIELELAQADGRTQKYVSEARIEIRKSLGF